MSHFNAFSKSIFKRIKYQNLGLSGFFFAQVLQSSLGILILPLLSHELSRSEFGFLTFVIVFSQCAGTILGLDSALALNFSFFNSVYGTYLGVKTKLFFLLIVNSIAFFSLLFVINSLLFDNYLLLLICIISVFNFALRNFIQSDQRLHNKILAYNITISFNTIVPGICLLFLISFSSLSYDIALLFFVAISLVANLAILSTSKLEHSSVDFRKIIEMCLTMLPHTIGVLVISFADRLIIARNLGLEILAEYQISFLIGNLSYVLVGIVINAKGLKLYQLLHEGKIDEFNRLRKFIVRIFFVVFLGISIVIPFTQFLLPNEYDATKIIVTAEILNMGALPYLVYSINLIRLQFQRQFRSTSIRTLISSIFTLTMLEVSSMIGDIYLVALVASLAYFLQSFIFSSFFHKH